MKVLVTLLVFGVITSSIYAQNVGIGTTNPTSPLHVVSSSSNPLKVDGSPGMFVSFYESGTYRGYWGSYAGNPEDVDFGTGGTNASGKIHFTIQASPAVTIAATKMVGIGTTSPTEMLDIESGNIILNNSPKGIILDASDNPFISRSFDPFTSGAKNGLGRWGLFMEPSRLTFGIPNLSGKAVEFATYNTNSTRNTLLTVDNSGEVQRPATGASDMLPVAYANISSGGSILSGTSNVAVTVVTPGSVYDISVSGRTLSQSNTVFFLTITNDGQGTVQNHGIFTGGNIRVVLIRANTSYARDFSIMIYQP